MFTISVISCLQQVILKLTMYFICLYLSLFNRYTGILTPVDVGIEFYTHSDTND